MIQLYTMQDLAFSVVQQLKETFQVAIASDAQAQLASAIASVIRSWETLEERKRILKGNPLPGTLRPREFRTMKAARNRQLAETIVDLPAAQPAPDPLPTPDPVVDLLQPPVA